MTIQISWKELLEEYFYFSTQMYVEAPQPASFDTTTTDLLIDNKQMFKNVQGGESCDILVILYLCLGRMGKKIVHYCFNGQQIFIR